MLKKIIFFLNNGENIFIRYFYEHRNIVFFICINVIGLVLRYLGRNFLSADAEIFLIPWYNEISQAGGIKALSSQVGNYNILYQTIIALLTYIPINSLYLYKIISILFDYILAFSSAVLVCRLTSRKMFDWIFQITYAAVLLLPTVVLNSAYWAQCDSMYVSFIILMLLSFYEEHYTWAFIFLGVAFAFKLQAIFIIPFVLCLMVYRKATKRLHYSLIAGLSISIFCLWLSGIGGYVSGRPLTSVFKLYAEQTGQYISMWMNAPSFWVLVGNNYEFLHVFAIGLTIALCGMGLLYILNHENCLDGGEAFMAAATWFVWICLLFLPAMHERYSYMLDILLLILCFFRIEYVKFFGVSFISSLMLYGLFLFNPNAVHVEQWQALACVVAWGWFTVDLLNKIRLKSVRVKNESDTDFK